MTDFFSNFDGFTKNGLSAEQYFYTQIYEAFKSNVENNTLPFFNNDLNKIPRELSTGKIINNENAIALEQIASKYGYKSNLWIYGDELNKLQKEVGDLYYKRGTMPALCLTRYFDSTHLNEQDLYISEGGSGNREQYLYNVDSLTDRSKQKILKYYEQANAVDKVYTSENLKAFHSNIKLNQSGNKNTLMVLEIKLGQQVIKMELIFLLLLIVIIYIILPILLVNLNRQKLKHPVKKKLVITSQKLLFKKQIKKE